MELFNFFQKEEGKSLFLNSFTEAFLKSPSQKILITPNTAIGYFGWTKEMLYIYNELPTRLANWFVENPDVNFYSGILFDGKDQEFSDINKKLFGIDISGVDFPISSRWFDLNVYDFLSVVVSHHMKSVMVSKNNKKGIITNEIIKNIAGDAISSLIVDFWKQVKQGKSILPLRIVELIVPIFEIDIDLNNPNAKANAKAKTTNMIKTLLTTEYRKLFKDVTWKIPEHHLYLFDVANLINSELSSKGVSH